MLDRRLHIEPLWGRLFAGHNDVDVVPAAQAVIGHGQQCVRIWWEIHADDFRLLVHHVVNEAGVLMTKAVVILAPDVGREQVIQRGNGAPPGNVARGF